MRFQNVVPLVTFASTRRESIYPVHVNAFPSATFEVSRLSIPGSTHRNRQTAPGQLVRVGLPRIRPEFGRRISAVAERQKLSRRPPANDLKIAKKTQKETKQKTQSVPSTNPNPQCPVFVRNKYRLARTERRHIRHRHSGM